MLIRALRCGRTENEKERQSRRSAAQRMKQQNIYAYLSSLRSLFELTPDYKRIEHNRVIVYKYVKTSSWAALFFLSDSLFVFASPCSHRNDPQWLAAARLRSPQPHGPQSNTAIRIIGVSLSRAYQAIQCCAESRQIICDYEFPVRLVDMPDVHVRKTLHASLFNLIFIVYYLK